MIKFGYNFKTFISMKTNERNQNVIDLHNSGKTIREIEKETGIGKSTVNRIIAAHLETVQTAKVVVPVPTKESKVIASGNRIPNFGEYAYTGQCNTYAHKETGEIITVKFVPAKAPEQCGYFVTV